MISTIIAWVLINIAILIGVWLLCMILSIVLGFLGDDLTAGVLLGNIAGIFLVMIGIVVSLIVWAVNIM